MYLFASVTRFMPWETGSPPASDEDSDGSFSAAKGAVGGPAHARPHIPKRLLTIALQIFHGNDIFIIKNRMLRWIVAQSV